MNSLIVGLLTVLLTIISLGMIYDAYGHGIGAETLAPQSLGDKQAFIEVNAINVADAETDQQFTFKVIDAQTGQAVRDITYEIIASKQGVALFDERFKSGSGALLIDLVHSDSGEIQVEKQASGIFGFMSGDTDVARVTGPYFDYGGLYQFNIRILTADSFSNNLMPPPEWSSGISIADTTEHVIDDANFGTQTLRHISYYDIIENFEYDPAARSISFEMPFDADFDTINQTSVIHEETVLSKDFGDLMVSDIRATVNGVRMPKEVIQIDDFTEDVRIIHLTMTRNNILELYKSDSISEERLSFVVSPEVLGQPYSTITRNGQFKIIMNPVPADPASGGEVEIRYKLFDVFLKDLPVKVDYNVRVTQQDALLFSTQGTSSDDIGEFESVRIPIPEDTTGIVYVHFENLAGNPLASARLPIVIDRVESGGAERDIPQWIKNNAGWWSEGKISDDEFVRGIEFLIAGGIITVMSTESGGAEQGIPQWIKNNAGWWSEGKISDDEFVRGIEFLIAGGIIRV